MSCDGPGVVLWTNHSTASGHVTPVLSSDWLVTELVTADRNTLDQGRRDQMAIGGTNE